MNKIIRIIESTINIIGISLISIMFFSIGSQVFLRYFFNKPLKFPEELSMFILVAIVFLGVNIVEIYESHIKVGFIFTKISKKYRELIIILNSLFNYFIMRKSE